MIEKHVLYEDSFEYENVIEPLFSDEDFLEDRGDLFYGEYDSIVIYHTHDYGEVILCCLIDCDVVNINTYSSDRSSFFKMYKIFKEILNEFDKITTSTCIHNIDAYKIAEITSNRLGYKTKKVDDNVLEIVWR